MKLCGRSARKRPLPRRLGIAMLVSCGSALVIAFAPAAAQAAPPNNTSPPTISGDPVEGETLTGNEGTWDDPAATFAFRWQRSDGVGGYDNIGGATGTTYTLTSADVGHTIRLRVIATNAADEESDPAFSAPTAEVAPPPPANTSPPTISGETMEGEILTGTAGTWDDPAATFAYQWQRSDGVGSYESIPGATDTTYLLTSEDVGGRIRLRVIASNGGGASAPAVSAPTAIVAPAPVIERSLELSVKRRPEAFKRAFVRAEGVARPALRLWVLEKLRGKECPATPAERTGRTRLLIDGEIVGGTFSEERRPRMKRPGPHAFCAYLGPDEDTVRRTSFVTRKVRKPFLSASRARETVKDALKRHGFANRVLANLSQSCARRSRSEFECQFSSSFPGYSLSGHGSVERKRRVSYRFPVAIEGRSFTLTDENEGGLRG
jgi:hypothetical protein